MRAKLLTGCEMLHRTVAWCVNLARFAQRCAGDFQLVQFFTNRQRARPGLQVYAEATLVASGVSAPFP